MTNNKNRSVAIKLVLGIASWMFAGCMAVVTTPTHAQTRVRGHVLLPRTAGATVLSTYINASANRVLAVGDFLESAAVARQIHLESDRIAMENSIKWVETYFERRKLNREYRDELKKDYQERKFSIAQATHKRIINSESVADPTSDLNYMLNALLGDENAFAAIFLADEPVISCRDMELTVNDISSILMNAGSGNEFQLGKTVLLDTIWPKVFDRAEFEEIRLKYDAARERTIDEIRQGDLSLATFEHLNRLLVELSKNFEQVYLWQRMRETIDIATLVHYKEVGNRFIRTQRAGALRAFASKDPSAYELRFQFDGDKLTDLLRYCSSHHVNFASSANSAIDVYARLYQSLRTIYLEFITNVDAF